MTEPSSVEPIVAKRAALMLMDYQPAVLTHVGDHDTLLERAATALGWAREHDVRVVFVRVAFIPEDYDGIPHHHKAFGVMRRNRLLPDGDPALEIHPALQVSDRDIVVRKTRFGAFSTTNLHLLLGDASVDTLVMGGISTSGVMLSTVRDASDQDYRILVLADATADPDPEVHRVLVEKVLPRQADVINTDDLKLLTR